MTLRSPVRLTEQLLHRICSEYLEMPGLRLTPKQAQRLWGLDEETCAQSLDFLVQAKFLARIGPDTYRRLTDGAAKPPTLRMAKSSLYRPHLEHAK
jgi:hypothetical protein